MAARSAGKFQATADDGGGDPGNGTVSCRAFDVNEYERLLNRWLQDDGASRTAEASRSGRGTE